MLEVENLRKSFGDKLVVDSIDFSVQAGEIFVLLGKSGCGKTTTLKMINRLIPSSGGTIRIQGENVNALDPVKLRRKIGYVIQENGLFPHYTIAQNIAVVPKLLDFPKEEIEQRTQEMLHMMELDPDAYLDKYPRQLSGGQQQRIAIARALVARPPLLLMDEPFSALDPLTRHNVRIKFRQLVRDLGTTVVMVTHDLSEALELGDRICLMDLGRIAQLGTPRDLIFHPASEAVKTFFSGQTLESELKVLKLEDLQDHLPPWQDAQAGSVTVSMQDSLAQILEDIEARFQQTINVMDQSGQMLGSLVFRGIFGAYQQLKNLQA